MELGQIASRRPRATRVGVIGFGSIGRSIIASLRQGHVPGSELGGVLTRSDLPEAIGGSAARSLDDLIERSDLIVEAAGHSAVKSLGPTVIDSGTDLLLLSVGALADDELFSRLAQGGGGRLLISTGAVGGIDTLRAAMILKPLEKVSLTSTKPAGVLVRPWMSPELQEALTSGHEEVETFSGPARDAVTLFPESANIAATLALATVGFDNLHVRIIGAPGTAEVEHRVRAEGYAGSYDFLFRNRPSEDNPKTSAITPFSVVRALQRMQANLVIGI